MTEEQNATIVQAQVDAHFEPKPAPPPREKVFEEKIDHFIRMARPPALKPIDSDYERQIRKAHRARLQKESSSSSSQAAGKICRKTVPQLGEQATQSIPPLVVPTHESTGTGQLVITDEHRRNAEMLDITVGQLLEIEPMPELKEEEIDHFIRMARPPAPKPVDSDYERQIRKAHRARQKNSSSISSQAASQKCGKIIPQLGEQAAQSIPRLVYQHMSVPAPVNW